jgi:hypothetical protein
MDGSMAYKIKGTDRIPDNCGRAHRLYTHGNAALLKTQKVRQNLIAEILTGVRMKVKPTVF